MFCFKRKKQKKFISEQGCELMLASLKYEMFDEIKNLDFPQIQNIEHTIEMLQNSNNSLCRFGDGELSLIAGQDIPLQKASPLLSQRLKEVLSSSIDNLQIAIPRVVYGSKVGVNDHSKKFWRIHGKNFRQQIEKYIDLEKQYYSAEVTLAYALYQSYDFEQYFSNLRDIWNDKDIVLVCGKNVFDQIKFNIFNNAKSTENIHIANINSFDNYDYILKECLKMNKNALFIAIAGPTAKILAYDLTKKGYRILDLGHIAKSYDWFKKSKDALNSNNAHNFFAPD